MDTIKMSFRVDKELKKEADKFFKSQGMNTSMALNLFLNECVKVQGLPFKPSLDSNSKK